LDKNKKFERAPDQMGRLKARGHDAVGRGVNTFYLERRQGHSGSNLRVNAQIAERHLVRRHVSKGGGGGKWGGEYLS